MKKLLTILIGLSLWVPNLLGQDLKPEEMREDLLIFRESLEKFHPEMYRYTDRQTFENHFKAIEAQLTTPKSQREFYNLLKPVLVDLKDGHIKWIVQGQDQHYGFFQDQLFPLRLYFEEQIVKVISHLGGEKVPVLAEVKSINGETIEAIREKLLAGLTYGDGESLGGKYFQLNRYFAAYFSTEYGVSESYTVELTDSGKSVKWEGKGIGKDQIEANFKEAEEPFSFKMTNGWTGIMDINRFFSYKGEPDFKKFLKNSFESLENEGISNLILDLRGNEGGNEKLGIDLYKYLALDEFDYYDFVTTKPNQKVDFENYTSKIFRMANSFSKEKDGKYLFTKAPSKTEKPYKNAFQGNLIVLVDGQSFSVTTEFSSRVKSDRRATFVGEETAGGAEVNSSGFFTIITLPHSKIDLGVPRLGFHMADLDSSMDKNRGIIPDVRVVPTAGDLLSAKDPVMERALQLVKRP
ncbi:peptidase S41 [Algoriphagus lacus]|uniref:Peptidase S41 n=1 Tax=Algoriphagus lacus TaxID=2056311 RepID=A0A418PSI8_9BACT|nr:S41 family peptidase [Algoriphagus lacus]RIW15775.1 peptidase S41 [Algoriphagus lacus]